MIPKKIALLVAAIGLGLFLLIAAFCSAVTVDKGNVGVVSHWSAIESKPLDPGLHFVMPFRTSVDEMSTKLGSYEVAGEQALSKDLQVITTTISIQHEMVGAVAPKVLENIGTLEDLDANVVNPAVQESLKAVTARYTAEQLVTMRDTVKTEATQAIKDYIAHTLKQKDCEGALRIANVAIEDFRFSDQFNKSIEAKVKAEQESLQAVNEKKRRITDAEAAFEKRKLNADAEAYQITKKSEARAAAIEREAAALRDNPDLIRLRSAEKWDGNLPVYNSGASGSAPVPFINVDKINQPAPAENPGQTPAGK
ncbi:MAG: prohibitin family protein [Candidatus Melainabacteria bacterium]|nr:prohibitin family protein [Candidatus Melainabacteria bacterium]